MSVMNIDRVYFCCLYGNNEDEAIIRHIDRDMDYEAELIALEQTFWHENVLAKVPPPYTEDGDLILESLRRKLGPSEDQARAASRIGIENYAVCDEIVKDTQEHLQLCLRDLYCECFADRIR